MVRPVVVVCSMLFYVWFLVAHRACLCFFVFFSRKLSKALGAVMFLLYGGFVASDLARANWDMACDATDWFRVVCWMWFCWPCNKSCIAGGPDVCTWCVCTCKQGTTFSRADLFPNDHHHVWQWPGTWNKIIKKWYICSNVRTGMQSTFNVNKWYVKKSAPLSNSNLKSRFLYS